MNQVNEFVRMLSVKTASALPSIAQLTHLRTRLNHSSSPLSLGEIEEQLQCTFLQTCWRRFDLLEQYSKHLNIEVVDEPAYIQALNTIYSKAVDISMQAARLRQEVLLKQITPEAAALALNDETATTDGGSQDTSLLAGHIHMLTTYEPEPEFEDFHADMLRFIGDLGEQLRRELDVLEQTIAGKQIIEEVKSIPDALIDSVDKSISASSASSKEDRKRIYLSSEAQIDFNEMDIIGKFEVLYFYVKNYFHFGKTEI